MSRRINAFEESMGERLFERSAQGYECTAIGNEVYEETAHLERSINRVERRVMGEDTSMSGNIRITLPSIIGKNLLVQDLVDFCLEYPDIQLEIINTELQAKACRHDIGVGILPLFGSNLLYLYPEWTYGF